MDPRTKLTLTWHPGTADEDSDVCTFDDFRQENEACDVAIVAALAPGESHTFGGGAATVVRVSVVVPPRPDVVARADRAARDAVPVVRRSPRYVADDDEPNHLEYAREREGGARG